MHGGYAKKTVFVSITYDKEQGRSMFYFECDGANDIVSLTRSTYKVEALGKCLYYGYEFADTVDGNVRTFACIACAQ